jgi:hypothetical protein
MVVLNLVSCPRNSMCFVAIRTHRHTEANKENLNRRKQRKQRRIRIWVSELSWVVRQIAVCARDGRRARLALAEPARSQTLELSRQLFPFLFNPIFLPKPLSKRLYSAKISQALWLVIFSRYLNGNRVSRPSRGPGQVTDRFVQLERE